MPLRCRGYHPSIFLLTVYLTHTTSRSLSGVLTARFILDLKAWNSKEQEQEQEPVRIEPPQPYNRVSRQAQDIAGWASPRADHPFLFSHMAEFGEDPEVTARRLKRAVTVDESLAHGYVADMYEIRAERNDVRAGRDGTTERVVVV